MFHVNTLRRVYDLQATSEEELIYWIDGLETILAQRLKDQFRYMYLSISVCLCVCVCINGCVSSCLCVCVFVLGKKIFICLFCFL